MRVGALDFTVRHFICIFHGINLGSEMRVSFCMSTLGWAKISLVSTTYVRVQCPSVAGCSCRGLCQCGVRPVLADRVRDRVRVGPGCRFFW